MAVTLGRLVKGVKLEDIDFGFKKNINSVFKDAACGGVITDDVLAPEHVALMTPEAVGRIKTRTISFLGDREVVAEVDNHRSSSLSHFKLGDPKTEEATGLPLALQNILKKDLTDYFNLTGKYTTTRLYMGNQLECTWNLALSARHVPVMVRDLSGRGLFIATPKSGSEKELYLEVGAHGQGLYAHGKDVKRLQQEGRFDVEMQPAGSRLFFNDKLLMRDHTVWPEESVGQLRAYTGFYDRQI